MNFINLKKKIHVLKDGFINVVIQCVFLFFIYSIVEMLFPNIDPYKKTIIVTIGIFTLLIIIFFYDCYVRSISNFNKGYEFHIKKEYDLAIEYYNKAIKLNPIFAGAYLNRGAAFIEKHDYDLAIKDCKRVLRLKPKHISAHLNRGEAFARKHEYDLAIADFDKVIKFDPTYVDAYFNKGDIYELQNRRQDAMDTYQNLIKNIPNDEENIEKANEKIRILEDTI